MRYIFALDLEPHRTGFAYMEIIRILEDLLRLLKVPYYLNEQVPETLDEIEAILERK